MRLFIRLVAIALISVGNSCDEVQPDRLEFNERQPMKKKQFIKKAKPYPGKVRTVLPGEKRKVFVANPRKRGRKNYVSPDGHIESGRSNKNQVLVLNYGVFLIQLVQLEDGRVIDPVMLVKYPKKRGLFGGIVMEDSWSVEMQWAGPSEAPDDGWAHFAVSDKIKKYILLLESNVEKTGLRVLELNPKAVANVKTVKIPDLLTLTPLEKHPDGNSFWKLHLAAEKEDDRLKNLE